MSTNCGQLFLILIDNAMKYTPDGGQILVSLRHDGKEVVVEIADSGVGIQPEDLPHVFERFYRADKARSRDTGGAGLGLSIAHWIVNAHAGRITIDSEPGKGTKCHVAIRTIAGS